MSTKPRDTALEYWETVDSLAQDAVKQKDDYGYDWSDSIWGMVDGNYWVIYTHAARKVLQHTDSEDAYWDDTGNTSIEASSTSDVLTILAFYAMRRDVEEKFAKLSTPEDVEEPGHEWV